MYPLKVLKPLPRAVAAILLAGAAASCRTAAPAGPPIIQPGAPGEEPKAISAEKAADLSDIGHTDADTRFMQGMISHHAQALEMVALVPERTARDEMRLLAERIRISQADEIQMMQEWLKARGEEPADPHAHHHGHLMPGMLTQEEMTRLAAAKGDEFDRLFLEGMIKHHDGALVMVRELFATAGAAQDSDIFQFASDVDADQRMEIVRMAGMLKELQR